ncbi:MAG: fibronectin type III domain-containing protein [Bacteroidales bacterium]|jgi:hypothetical protein|nr:fibronectin type III domain-containing protein [Bacteroidales bacterium]
MKKQFLFTAWCLLAMAAGYLTPLWGQSYSTSIYKFSTESDAFTPLSGATRVSAISDTVGSKLNEIAASSPDDVVIPSADAYASGFPVGFDFVFHGDTFNRFLISGRGFIKLGRDSVSAHFGQNAINPTGRGKLTLESIGLDANATNYGRTNTSISYKLEGSTPDQKLTVEFLNLGYNSTTKTEITDYTDDSISYQIILYEADNKIELVFGNMCVKNTSPQFAIGLVKANYGTMDMHFRLPGSNRNWLTTTFTSSALGTNTCIGQSGATFPSGTKFVFEVPSPCAAPVATPTSFSITTRASTFIKGSLSLPETGADGYAIYTSDSITADRENMTLLTEGTLTATVDFTTPVSGSSIGTNDGWTKDIPKSDKKYVYAYLTNTVCIGKEYGPPIVDSGKYMPLPPTSFSVVSNTPEAITLSVTARNPGDTVIIAVNSVMSGDGVGNSTNAGYFGVPQGIVNINDVISFNSELQSDDYEQCPWRHPLYSNCRDNALLPAGTVIYKGTEISDFTFTDLQPNRVYFFGAWTKNAEGEYSTVAQRASALAQPVTPYTVNFEQSNTSTPPFGWEVNTAGEKIFNVNTSANGFVSNSLGTGTWNAEGITPFIKTESSTGARLAVDVSGYATPVRFQPNTSLYENFNENDTVYFEVSTDGIEYNVVKIWVRDDMPEIQSTSTKVEIPLVTSAAAFKLRIRWNMVTSAYSRYLQFSNFLIEDIPACEPIKTLSINAGTTSATVSWTALEEASVFDVRYRPKTDEVWKTVRVTGENSVTLEDLPLGPVAMEVEVRSVCAVGNSSEWVSDEFKTGYALPFYDNFDSSFIDFTNRATPGSSQRLFPKDWDEYIFSAVDPFDIFSDTNISGSISLVSPYTSMILTTVRAYSWKNGYPAGNPTQYTYNDGRDQATIWNHSNSSANSRRWLLTKEFQLPNNTKVAFDISVKQAAATSLSAGTGLTPGAKFYVAFIPSTGTDTLVVTKGNLLLELDSADIMELFLENTSDSVHYDLYLSSVTEVGSVVAGRIGFNYVTDLVSAPASLLYLDNVAVEAACLPMSGLAVTYSSIDSINIKWNIAADAAEGYVLKVYEDIESDPEAIAVTDAFYKYVPASAGWYGFKAGYVCENDTVWSDIVPVTVSGDVCDVPANITVTETTTSTATIAWEGSGIRYNVQVRALDSVGDTDPTEWETYVTTENTYTISPLLEGKVYEYRVQTVCGDDVSGTSEYSAVASVTPKQVTCFAPYEIITVPTYYDVTISWSDSISAGSYEYGIRQGSSGEWTVTATEETSVNLTTVLPQTAYQVRVRSICDATDQSAWSAPAPFTTLAVPTCPLPSNLTAKAVTATTATLSWTAPEDRESFVVTYHAEAILVWDTAAVTADTFTVVEDLSPNTMYIWRVRNMCDHGRASSWASGENFTTLQEVAIEGLNSSSTLKIYADKGQIHILNPDNEYVERVVLTSANGATLQKHVVRTVDNMLITTSTRNQIVIVSVYGKNREIQHTKVLLK